MQSWWSIPSTNILTQLAVNSETGLFENELNRRLHQYGPNSIKPRKKLSRWSLLLKQFKNPVVYVLLIAFFIAFALKEYLDGWTILSIVIINAVIGFVQESKAGASIQALSSLTSPKGKVLREGKIVVVHSEAIFPGDILVLEAGDYVVADARIILSRQLAAEKVPDDYLISSQKPSANSFFDRSFYQEMILVSVMITVLSLGVYYYSLTKFDLLTARSLAFSFLVYIVLIRSFSCRSETKTFFESKLNWYHLASVIIPMLFQIGMQKFDLFLDIFKIKPLSILIHIILLGLAIIPVTVVELIKIWRRA